MMKAAVYRNYGAPGLVRIEQLEKPVPKERELLIKVQASAVNSADVRLRKADPFAVRFVYGLFAPKKPVLGVVFSGIVESAGKKVTRFKPGDAVFGSCDDTMGAHAEFLCVSETGAIALKPENLNFEEAASIIFGGTTANYFLNRGNVAAGKKVLVYGASGSVGSAAVQLAKSRDAYVTAVCSTSNLALMKTLGADAVLDYTIPGFMDGTERYDVIFETVNKADIAGCVWNLTQIGH